MSPEFFALIKEMKLAKAKWQKSKMSYDYDRYRALEKKINNLQHEQDIKKQGKLL